MVALGIVSTIAKYLLLIICVVLTVFGVANKVITDGPVDSSDKFGFTVKTFLKMSLFLLIPGVLLFINPLLGGLYMIGGLAILKMYTDFSFKY